MLLHNIRWDGEDIVLEMYDVDGDRKEVRLNAPDALDVSGWLLQEKHKLLEVIRRYNRAGKSEV